MADVTGTTGNDTILVGSASAGVVPPTGATDAADRIRALAGADTVVPGPGDDVVSLGDGSDLFVWNPGDGSDTANGNAGFDRHLFNGSDGNEVFTISDDGANVELLRDLGNIDMDLRGFERINLVALGGDDRVDASGLTNPVSLRIDGGAGNDSIIGSAGADTIVGGAGNDTVVGGPGDDVVSLGDGSDLFVWNPGDGSDTANGNAGFDRHLFNGSDGNEVFTISDDGANVELLRDLGNIDMDLRGFERINLVALGGDDRVDASGLTNPVSLRIDGGAGNDSIIGSAGADTIVGGAGNDTVVGGPGDDVVSLGDGSDLFVWNPGDGSDTANGNAGFDRHLFNGSDGNEVFTISDDGANVELLRDLGNIDMDLRGFERINLVALGGDDRVDASGLTNPVSLRIDGGAGNDSIIGSAGADTIVGGAGNDTVVGGPGDDVVSLGDGSDLFVWNPGDGSDTANGNAGFDRHLFNGSDGNEVFTISDDGANVELLRDLGNIDMDLRGFERINLVALGGDDRVDASGLTNPVSLRIDGGAGNDSIIGSAGADTIVGGAGNDTVVGGPGDDVVSLGDGSDLFVWNPGDGSDTANGNAGFDRHLFNGSDGNEVFTISDDGANVELLRDLGNIDMDLRGFERINLVALGGDDRVDASGLTNPVSLRIDGGAGNDSIIGSAGADTIVGGAGNDTVVGGPGDDTFDFNAVSESPAGGGDTVAGVNGIGAAGGDVFDLSTIDANTLLLGNQVFTFIGEAAFSAASQIRVSDSGGSTLIQGNVNGGLAADLEILVQDGAIDPADYAAGDFIL